jgi:hypothetical protein
MSSSFDGGRVVVPRDATRLGYPLCPLCALPMQAQVGHEVDAALTFLWWLCGRGCGATTASVPLPPELAQRVDRSNGVR